MNAIESLAADLRRRLPDATFELIEPTTKRGRWLLEVEHDAWVAAVVWVPERGFGLSVRPSDDPGALGEGPDESPLGAPRRVASRVAALLRGKERTTPPHAVALRELRARCGLTQSELAERLDVGQGTVSKLERNQRLDVGRLAALVAAMGGELELWVRFPDEARLRLLPPGS